MACSLASIFSFSKLTCNRQITNKNNKTKMQIKCSVLEMFYKARMQKVQKTAILTLLVYVSNIVSERSLTHTHTHTYSSLFRSMSHLSQNVYFFLQSSSTCGRGTDWKWDEVWRCHPVHQTVRTSLSWLLSRTTDLELLSLDVSCYIHMSGTRLKR